MGGLISAWIFLGSAIAPDPKPIPIRIQFDAPPGCSRVEAFYQGIRSRTDTIRLATEGEVAQRITLHLMPVDGNVEGELRMLDDEGETVRWVEGATCDQVVDVLSLTAALAFGRAPREPVAARDNGAEAAALAFELGARLSTSEVVSPYVSMGGELFVRLTKRTIDPGRPTLDLGILHARNDLFTPESSVSVRLTAIALTLCPTGWGLSRAWRLQPCVVGLGGWLEAFDSAVDHPASAVRAWWSVGGRLRAAGSLSARVTLELEAGVTVPLARRNFFVRSPDQVVGETPAVSFLGALGIAYRF